MARLDEIAELLRVMDADIVVLNEVDFDASWSYSVNQARYLAEKAGYAHRVEQRNVDFRVLFWTWRFGNAVLSKYPIVSANVLDLPGYSTFETILAGKKRSVVCDIETSDRILHIVAAHLSHRSEAVRVASAKMITHVAAGKRLPTIVTGDMNSTPSSFPRSRTAASGENAVAVFDGSQLFRRTPTQPPMNSDQLTFPSSAPALVIDWVLIPADWRFVEYRVVSSQLSDHRPVCVDVEPLPSFDLRESNR